MVQASLSYLYLHLADSNPCSWELGLLNQVLLERGTPSLSVFTPNSIPPDVSTADTDLLDPVFNVTEIHMKWLLDQNNGNIPTNISQGRLVEPGFMQKSLTIHSFMA